MVSTPTESTPAVTAATPSRLPSLTGIRFPAAVIVFVFHSSLPQIGILRDSASQGRYYDAVINLGATGVLLFFVLSGFVLTWSARPGESRGSFYRKRFSKIFPLYAVTWVIAVLVMSWGKIDGILATLYLFMLHVWVPNSDVNFAINPPGWSLAVEAFFYLCFPFLLVVVVALRKSWLLPTLAGLIVVVFALPYLSTLLPAGTHFLVDVPTVSGNYYWFDYVCPPARLPDFLVGAVAARVLAEYPVLPRIPLSAAVVVFVGFYIVSINSPLLYGQRPVMLFPSLLVVLSCAQLDLRQVSSLLRSRVAIWLGNISFAFYLVHFSVLYALRHWVFDDGVDGPVGVLAFVAIAFALTVAVSWMLHRFVELPGVHLAARVAAARRHRTVRVA